MRVVHCTPVNDLIDHIALDDDCPCGPTPDFVPGGVLWVHHSLDGRELREREHPTS